tara:strand:+ start:61 stop:624 length:564 start_codon:yes stop_codon:yes gene_type:complete
MTSSEKHRQWDTIRCVIENQEPESYCEYTASESTNITPSLTQYRHLTSSMIVWWDEEKDTWQTNFTGTKASLEWTQFWNSLPDSNEFTSLKNKAKQFDHIVTRIMPNPSDVSSLPEEEFTNLITGQTNSHYAEVFVFDEIIIPYIGNEPPRGYLRLNSKETLKLDALEFELRQEYWNTKRPAIIDKQ